MTLLELTRHLISFVLIVNTMSMGFQVSLVDVVQSLRHPGRISLWVLANFVLMPVATLALLRAFDASPMVSAGFFVLAACAGAPAGPRLAAKARADVPAAVAQMFFLGTLSAVLSPLLLTCGLPHLMDAGDLVPIEPVVIIRVLLVVQILPLAAGLGLHAWVPWLTTRIERPVRILGTLALLSVLVLIIAREFDHLAAIRMRGWLAMSLLLVISLATGWLCGGRDETARRTLALTTASRNSPVALVIVSQSFSGTPALTAVVAYTLVCMVGALACVRIIARFPPPVPVPAPV
jgi:BASS family bile acid:Na+ symporter